MTIQLDFERFHDANPGVYDDFKALTFEGIAKGKTRLSAHFLCQMIVWNKGVKVNNNFSSRYARMFDAEHPAHSDVFETREILTA